MKLFEKKKKHKQLPSSLDLLREATEREKAALDYDISDPYLAGMNAGRAEILRRWSETLK